MNIQVSKSKRIISYMIIYLIVMQLFLANAIQVYAAGNDVEKSDRIIVSMGDSYSSGEGLGDYGYSSDPKDKIKDANWLGHRSNNAWGGQLYLKDKNGKKIKMSEHRNENWFFVASSGAETVHVKTDRNADKEVISASEYKKLEKQTGYQEKEYSIKDANLQGKKYIRPQLSIFDDLDKMGKKADYVTLTIGGNDLGFFRIAACSYIMIPYVDYALALININIAVREFDENKKDNMISKLESTYKKIIEKAGKQAKLIVAGYPRLYEKSALNLNVSRTVRDSFKMINSAVDFFNGEVEAICNRIDNVYYVQVADSDFYGAYAVGECLSGIRIKITNDILDDNMDGVGLSASSMHPNKKGAEIYRKCVQKMINELDKDYQSNDNSDDSSQEKDTQTVQSEQPSASEGEVTNQAAGTEYQDFIQDKIDSALAIGDNYIQVGEEDYYCKYSIADFDGDGANELAIYSENWWGGGFQEASTGGASIMFYKYNQGSGVVEEIGGFGGLDAFWDNLNGECPFVFHKNGYITIGDYVSGVKYDWVDSIALLPMQDMNGNTISDSSQLWKWGSVGVNIDVNAENPVSAYYTEGMGVSTYYPVNGDEFVNNINNILSSETISPTFYNFGN